MNLTMSTTLRLIFFMLILITKFYKKDRALLIFN